MSCERDAVTYCAEACPSCHFCSHCCDCDAQGRVMAQSFQVPLPPRTGEHFEGKTGRTLEELQSKLKPVELTAEQADELDVGGVPQALPDTPLIVALKELGDVKRRHAAELEVHEKRILDLAVQHDLEAPASAYDKATCVCGAVRFELGEHVQGCPWFAPCRTRWPERSAMGVMCGRCLSHKGECGPALSDEAVAELEGTDEICARLKARQQWPCRMCSGETTHQSGCPQRRD